MRELAALLEYLLSFTRVDLPPSWLSSHVRSSAVSLSCRPVVDSPIALATSEVGTVNEYALAFCSIAAKRFLAEFRSTFFELLYLLAPSLIFKLTF